MAFKFETLEVWKRSIAFADTLFDIAGGLPTQVQFSLGEQLRRAALSVPTNIAEGSGRDAHGERQQFYRYAKGSVYEVVSLLVMLGRRQFLSRDAYATLYSEANEIAAILTTLSRRR